MSARFISHVCDLLITHAHVHTHAHVLCGSDNTRRPLGRIVNFSSLTRGPLFLFGQVEKILLLLLLADYEIVFCASLGS